MSGVKATFFFFLTADWPVCSPFLIARESLGLWLGVYKWFPNDISDVKIQSSSISPIPQTNTHAASTPTDTSPLSWKCPASLGGFCKALFLFFTQALTDTSTIFFFSLGGVECYSLVRSRVWVFKVVETVAAKFICLTSLAIGIPLVGPHCRSWNAKWPFWVNSHKATLAHLIGRNVGSVLWYEKIVRSMYLFISLTQTQPL